MATPKPVMVLSPAKRDLETARAWYEDQQPGLGAKFLEGVDQCLDAIGRNPNAFQSVAHHARRAIVKRFPYAIVYKTEENAVYVYSVFHTSQDPQKWMDRLVD